MNSRHCSRIAAAAVSVLACVVMHSVQAGTVSASLTGLPFSNSLTSPGLGLFGGSKTFTLTNPPGSTGAAAINQLAIGGPNAGDFAITGGTCNTSTVLAPSASCTVAVDYKASGVAQETAQLDVRCTPQSAAAAGYTVICDSTTLGKIGDLLGDLLIAAIATPLLSPGMLTVLATLLLAMGFYAALRRERGGNRGRREL